MEKLEACEFNGDAVMFCSREFLSSEPDLADKDVEEVAPTVVMVKAIASAIERLLVMMILLSLTVYPTQTHAISLDLLVRL